MLTSQDNPFALMVDPAAVFAAMESADRLHRLRRRVCHPLDKPVMMARSMEVEAYDMRIDHEIDRRRRY